LKAAEEAAAKDEADVKAAFERATQGNARGRLEVVRGRVEETLIREAK
ncbi:MAG: hypothetical protein GWO16_12275, partial [Gammaproteobacteria bacterium]|nr:hypothetical protein [Gammaproteobacteria bacterium]